MLAECQHDIGPLLPQLVVAHSATCGKAQRRQIVDKCRALGTQSVVLACQPHAVRLLRFVEQAIGPVEFMTVVAKSLFQMWDDPPLIGHGW